MDNTEQDNEWVLEVLWFVFYFFWQSQASPIQM